MIFWTTIAWIAIFSALMCAIFCTLDVAGRVNSYTESYWRTEIFIFLTLPAIMMYVFGAISLFLFVS